MSTPLRVSALLVTDDFTGVSEFYEGLGFEQVATGDPTCVGFVAGSTGVILTDRDFAARCWGLPVMEEVAGRWVPYIYFDHLPDADPFGQVIADTVTGEGTRELVLRTASGPIVLVERL